MRPIKPNVPTLNRGVVGKYCAPAAPRVLGAWSFSEGRNSTVYDVSSSHRDLSFVGGMSWAGVTRYGYAAKTDGVDGSYMTVPASATLAGLSKFTFQCVLGLHTAVAGNDRRYFWQEQTASAGFVRWSLWINGPSGGGALDNTIGVRWRDSDSGGGVEFNGATKLTVGQLYDVVVTFDAAGTTKIYVDGQLDGSLAGGTGSLNSTTSVSLKAGSGSANEAWYGYHGMVNIYPGVVWTAEAVAQAHMDPFELYWPDDPYVVGRTVAAGDAIITAPKASATALAIPPTSVGAGVTMVAPKALATALALAPIVTAGAAAGTPTTKFPLSMRVAATPTMTIVFLRGL